MTRSMTMGLISTEMIRWTRVNVIAGRSRRDRCGNPVLLYMIFTFAGRFPHPVGRGSSCRGICRMKRIAKNSASGKEST